MPYEALFVTLNSGKLEISRIAAIREGQTRPLVSFPNEEVHVVLLDCQEDDSAIKVYESYACTRAEYEANKSRAFRVQSLTDQEHFMGEANQRQKHLQAFTERDRTRGALLVRHVGGSAIESEFKKAIPFGPEAQTMPN